MSPRSAPSNYYRWSNGEACWNLLEVNVLGVVAVTQSLMPLLRRGRGRIVNVSSTSARSGLAMLSAYAASKRALEALSESIRSEAELHGVQVSLLVPGVIETPIWAKGLAGLRTLRAALGRDHAARYGSVLDTLESSLKTNQESGMAPAKVAAVAMQALTAPRPRFRYTVEYC